MDPLRAFIDRSRLRTGDRLPPERELSAELGLPRTALRRLLAGMEARGELTRHVGRGTYLGSGAGTSAEAAPPPAMPSTYPAEVLETRLMLEPQAAGFAARRASPDDIAELERAVARGRHAVSFEEFERWDGAFHRLVVAAARNGLLAALYATVDAARSDRIWGQLKRASLSAERREAYQASHARIAEAIGDRDAATAEAEMRRHLVEVSRNMLES